MQRVDLWASYIRMIHLQCRNASSFSYDQFNSHISPFLGPVYRRYCWCCNAGTVEFENWITAATVAWYRQIFEADHWQCSPLLFESGLLHFQVHWSLPESRDRRMAFARHRPWEVYSVLVAEQTLRRHWQEPKPLSGVQPRLYARSRYSSCAQTFRRWRGISCEDPW